MADIYDVTEGQCPEDCPDVEVATYCINELQQVQNISRVNVKKCCPEDCPCDGEYNSEGCTLCGKCDGHPGFDLPKTFCVADTQPAQNVMRVNVNKDGDDLWETGDGDILLPKEDRTFTIKKANEVNVADGSTNKYLNEQGNFTTINISHPALNDKNAEPNFQHVTQEEKDLIALTATIINGQSVTREDLLTLISNNELIPNSSYRITNYTTTTAQYDTTSAGHDFDIIVTALSNNKLSEDAKCVRKSGDTYFTNAKLEAWEIKYCIDNDTSRFAWADTGNGKGVIYFMKDEWNNECPYDFKNIRFKKVGVFLYTFGGITDDSLTGECHHNIMRAYTFSSFLRLNFNTFGKGCYSNTFGTGCHSNTFGNYCHSNTFGNYCMTNTFGYNCSCNSFGNYFMSNTFGNSCSSNTFGYNCSSNTFGYNFNSNTFGKESSNNTFGNECSYNTFGNHCVRNNFYAGTTGTVKKDYIQYIVVEDGCSYNNFYSDVTTSSSSFLQRIRIKGLQNTSATNTQITLSETNTNYEWLICYTSSGTLKQYCPNEEINNLLPLIYAGL